MSEEVKKNLDVEMIPPYLFIQDQKKLKQIENLLKDLILSGKVIERIRKTFEEELENGLREEPSSLQMENTYIPELPDGSGENDEYRRQHCSKLYEHLEKKKDCHLQARGSCHHHGYLIECSAVFLDSPGIFVPFSDEVLPYLNEKRQEVLRWSKSNPYFVSWKNKEDENTNNLLSGSHDALPILAHSSASPLQCEGMKGKQYKCNPLQEGKFLALDLGGTNFRILLAEFKKGEIGNPLVQHYEISEELRLGSGIALFDYIADCVNDFLKKNNSIDFKIPLGFTFSFPIAQHSLRSGVLVNWTKSFNCVDVIGKDVVQLLSKSLIKKGCYNVTVDVILNDTTGTLMMGALLDKKTSVGLIVGTGSNACYMEKAEKVKRWEPVRHGEKEVIIDIEWGAFGDNGVLDFLKTEFDIQVDKNSLLVSSFTFEKYISGKYVGELVRVILARLVEEGLLFGGRPSDILNTPHSFLSEFISKMEEDFLNGELNNTVEILDKLEVEDYAEDDIKLLQYVGSVAMNRSALLVSICLSVLVERIDKKEVTIAVTGSVYEKHPSYRFVMEKYLRLLTKKKFKLLRVSDGSGKGAAVVAAIAKKLEERFKDS